MSYRYNSVDIIVGAGLCAIVFSALLFVFATSGTFGAGASQSSAIGGALPSSDEAWLQPALGQAIVERSLLQLHTDQLTASATSEWNRAMLAHRNLQATEGGPFAFVMQRAVSVPEEHAARVQAVMGRSIVNFTQRGIRSGVMSADLYLSDYNQGMIRAIEARGERMHDAFTSSWQSILGRWIVDVSLEQTRRVAGAQEQLGLAIVHTTQARTVLEQAWADNQYQLGSLMAALDRSGVMNERVMAASTDTIGPETIASYGGMAVIPDIPAGYLMGAALVLCCVFFAGLILSAASREAKMLAEAKRNAGRWVYRMA